MSNYAVQAASLSAAIHVGRLNKTQTAFADKADLTDMVIAAVGQYVERNFDGSMSATFPGLGFEVEVAVKPLPPLGEAS